MYCGRCGAYLEDGLRYCTRCGAAVNDEKALFDVETGALRDQVPAPRRAVSTRRPYVSPQRFAEEHASDLPEVEAATGAAPGLAVGAEPKTVKAEVEGAPMGEAADDLDSTAPLAPARPRHIAPAPADGPALAGPGDTVGSGPHVEGYGTAGPGLSGGYDGELEEIPEEEFEGLPGLEAVPASGPEPGSEVPAQDIPPATMDFVPALLRRAIEGVSERDPDGGDGLVTTLFRNAVPQGAPEPTESIEPPEAAFENIEDPDPTQPPEVAKDKESPEAVGVPEGTEAPGAMGALEAPKSPEAVGASEDAKAPEAPEASEERAAAGPSDRALDPQPRLIEFPESGYMEPTVGDNTESMSPIPVFMARRTAPDEGAVGYVPVKHKHMATRESPSSGWGFNLDRNTIMGLSIAAGIVLTFLVVWGCSRLISEGLRARSRISSSDVAVEEVETEEADPELEADGEAGEVAVYESGNTTPVGNLTNGGYVAEGDGWVFCALPAPGDGWTTTSIVRMREDGSERSVIYTAGEGVDLIWHLNVENGRLYFTEDTGSYSSEVVSIAEDGSGRQTMGSAGIDMMFQVYRGATYQYKDGRISAFDPSEGRYWSFVTGPSADEYWRIWNPDAEGTHDFDTCYYFFVGGTEIRSVQAPSGDTAQRSVVEMYDNQSILNVIPTSEGLWILADNDWDGRGDEVLLASFDGSSLGHHAYTSAPASRMNASDSGVFVVVSDGTSTRIERVGSEADGGTVTLYYTASSDTEVAYLQVCGNYLYFGLPGSSQLQRISLDAPGTTPETV